MVAFCLLVIISSFLITVAEVWSCSNVGYFEINFSGKTAYVADDGKFDWCFMAVDDNLTLEESKKSCDDNYIHGQLMTMEHDENLVKAWRKYKLYDLWYLWVDNKESTTTNDKCWQIDPIENKTRNVNCNNRSSYICQRLFQHDCAFEEKIGKSNWYDDKNCSMQIITLGQQSDTQPSKKCSPHKIINAPFAEDVCHCMEKDHWDFDTWSEWEPCSTSCDLGIMRRISTKCGINFTLTKSCYRHSCTTSTLNTTTITSTSTTSTAIYSTRVFDYYAITTSSSVAVSIFSFTLSTLLIS